MANGGPDTNKSQVSLLYVRRCSLFCEPAAAVPGVQLKRFPVLHHLRKTAELGWKVFHIGQVCSAGMKCKGRH